MSSTTFQQLQPSLPNISTEQILHQPSHKLSSGKLNTQHNHIPDSQAALRITAKIKTLLLKSKTWAPNLNIYIYKRQKNRELTEISARKNSLTTVHARRILVASWHFKITEKERGGGGGEVRREGEES